MSSAQSDSNAKSGERFFSQYGEDRFLAERRLAPERGVFVDVGAGDAMRFSNSYWFELQGWSGLCADADPRQVEALRQKRKCAVEWAAVGVEGDDVVLFSADDPDYSSTLQTEGVPGRKARVPAAPLEALLERHSVELIDLLSIDTEGTELDVCRSMDWPLHQPRVVVIEYATAGRDYQEAEICRYFSELPYRLVLRTSANLVFVRSRRPRPLRLVPATRVTLARFRDDR